MLVMPKAIGTKPLFIDKEKGGIDMRDLRDPLESEAWKGGDTVRDDHSRVDLLFAEMMGLESKCGGSDFC
jgi:hypothetical protein